MEINVKRPVRQLNHRRDLPLKSAKTPWLDLSTMPEESAQGPGVAGQRAAVLALCDGCQGRRIYGRVDSAPRERRERELAGARRAVGLHAREAPSDCGTP
jgi:hypothetical protein